MFKRYNKLGQKGLKLSTTDGSPSFNCITGEHNNKFHGTFVVYVDETLESGNNQFLNLTDKISKKVESNPRGFLPFVFAYITIRKIRSGYFLEETKYAKHLNELLKN